MLDLFIFSKRFYNDTLLQHCINSIDQFVQDKINSYTIISNEPVDCDQRFTVVHDRELWELIDPQFKYQALYEEKWFMQQIMKLSISKLSKNNALIVDADLLFLQPIRFVEDDKFNFYMAKEYDQRYFDALQHLVGITKQTTLRKQSFISDFAVFNPNILESLQQSIETNHNQHWIDAIQNYVTIPNDLAGATISEYELYGNYLLSLKQDNYNLIDPIEYAMWHFYKLSDFKQIQSTDKLLDQLKNSTNNYYQCVMLTPD
jgi:hypothetical protein